MAEEKQIMQNTIIFSILKFISLAITIAIGLIIPKLLGPALLGLYSAMLLVMRYSRPSFQFFQGTAFKKIPFLRAKGENKEMQKVMRSTYTGAFYLTLITGILLILGSFFLPYDNEIRSLLRIMGIVVVFQQMFYFINTFVRSEKHFGLLGKIDLVYNGSRLLLLFPLYYIWGIKGVIIGIGFSYLIAVIYGHKKSKFNMYFQSSFSHIKKQFTYGIAPTILGSLETLFTSIDKVIIIIFYNRVGLGLYHFGAYIIEMIVFIPINFAVVLFPSQMERSAKDKNHLKNIAFTPIYIIAYLSPIIIAGACIFSYPLISFFFQEYLQSLPVLYILSLNAFFICQTTMLESVVLTINKEKLFIIPKVILIIFAVVLNILAIKGGYGLVGIALATVCIYIFYFLFLNLYLHWFFFKDKKIVCKEVGKLFLPFPITVVMLLLLQNVPDSTNVYFAVLRSIFQFILFLVAYSPFILYINKKTSVLKLLTNYCKEKPIIKKIYNLVFFWERK